MSYTNKETGTFSKISYPQVKHIKENNSNIGKRILAPVAVIILIALLSREAAGGS